jgi:mono/diheme cytochrome c family protein
MRDANAVMRVHGIRASETLYKAGDRSFAADYQRLVRDTDADVAIHALLAMNLLKVPETTAAARTALTAGRPKGLAFVAERIVNPPTAGRGGGRGGPPATADQIASLERGQTTYNELCFSCHGEDGRGTPTPGGGAGATLAPSLAGSDRVAAHRDYVIKAILHGLTGPLDGRSYPQVMPANGANRDEWVADVASFIRNSFGNNAGFVSTADVARVRAATADRTSPWTFETLQGTLPKPLIPDATWKVTASHHAPPTPSPNAAGGFSMPPDPAGALNYLGWTSGVAQEAGMWFQVELPRPARLTELQFTSTAVAGGRGVPPQWTAPRRVRVQVSADGVSWSAPVAETAGAEGTTIVTFAPVEAKFVRLTQTESVTNGPPWSMRLLRLYEAP